MTAVAPVCLALAVLLVPRPRAERRRMSVFGKAKSAPRVSRRVYVIAAAVAASALLLTLGIGVVVTAIVVTSTLALRWRRARADRQADTERASLLEALEATIAELRVGAHPSAAAEVASHETHGIAARAFATAAARARLGGAAPEGLRRPGTVVAPELDRVATAWQVADHHGLALAELLTAARGDLTGRIRFRTRTTAALAGARATAAVLACLPLLGIALGQLMGASPLKVLLDSPAGTILLPLGATLTCTGLLWTDAITARVLP